MNNKLFASLILFVVGALLITVACLLAPIVYEAPSTGKDMSIIEWAYGVPSCVFTVAGVAGVLGGIWNAFYLLNNSR